MGRVTLPLTAESLSALDSSEINANRSAVRELGSGEGCGKRNTRWLCTELPPVPRLSVFSTRSKSEAMQRMSSGEILRFCSA